MSGDPGQEAWIVADGMNVSCQRGLHFKFHLLCHRLDFIPVKPSEALHRITVCFATECNFCDAVQQLLACANDAGEGLKRLDYRVQGWDAAFAEYLARLAAAKPLLLCGDLNCAHQELDIHNPKSNKRSAGFTDVRFTWPPGGGGRVRGQGTA